MYISQIMKKWRETLQPSSTEQPRPKIVEILQAYENEREEIRKTIPQFVAQLPDVITPASLSGSKEEVKVKKHTEEAEKKPEAKQKTRADEEGSEKKTDVRHGSSRPSGKLATGTVRKEEDEWDREMKGFTEGLFANESHHDDSAEADVPDFNDALDEQPAENDFADFSSEDIYDSTENEDEEESEEGETSEETEAAVPEHDLSLENLLKSISGKPAERKVAEGSSDKSQYRRLKHKRRRNNSSSRPKNEANGKSGKSDSDKPRNNKDSNNKKHHMKW
jgi:hypothetical protein